MMQTTDNHDQGTYLEVDDRPAVRFARTYDQPLERVWEAISDPAEMRHWFPSPEVAHDAREGGSITLSGDPYAPEAKTTRVLVWDPPHRFSFEWADDELHFTLTQVDQGTRLELVNILSTSGAASRNAAGWEICLEHLDRVVAGTWQPSPSDGSMAEFLPVLEKYRGQGLPDDGWLPEAPTS
jgi:uncharacterized protein YndB with AHSA1/START domain